MRVLASHLEGKRGDSSECEDAIVVSDDFVVVIDGATDKTGARVDGATTGRFASRQLAEAARKLPSDVDAAECVALLSEAMASGLVNGLPDLPADRPSAVFAAYSRARREIWRVGDCSFLIRGRVRMGHKKIDEIAAATRAAFLRSLLLSGARAQNLLREDPGREMILPLLRQQYVFRNRQDDRRFGFGAIDGTPVPPRFIEVYPARGRGPIALATDGYARLFASLEETERYLALDIARDALRIGRHPSTKGVHPDEVSFDDRAFVLIEP